MSGRFGLGRKLGRFSTYPGVSLRESDAVAGGAGRFTGINHSNFRRILGAGAGVTPEPTQATTAIIARCRAQSFY